VISIKFSGAFKHEGCRSVENRPSHEKAQSLEEVRRSLGIVECLFLDLDFVEVGQPFQIRPQVDGGERSLKTIPARRLGVLRAPERFEDVDPGIFPSKIWPMTSILNAAPSWRKSPKGTRRKLWISSGG